MKSNDIIKTSLIAGLFSAKNLQANRRSLLEQLHERILFASDLDSIGVISAPENQDGAVIWSPDYTLQLLSVGSYSESGVIRRTKNLSFNIEDAELVSSTYLGGNDFDDHASQFRQYQATHIDLASLFGVRGESIQWSVRITDPDLYAAFPSTSGNDLSFEITGKTGIQAKTSLVVFGTDGSRAYSCEWLIRIDNGASSAISSKSWSHPNLTLIAEGEDPSKLLHPIAPTAGSPGGGSSSIVLEPSLDTLAEEPYLIYCNGTGLPGSNSKEIASFKVTATNWNGSSVKIQVSGTATIGSDYYVGTAPFVNNYPVDALNQITITGFTGTQTLTLYITALKDNFEPPLEPSTEIALFNWANGQPNMTGSASVNIFDEQESVTLSTSTATTSELGPPEAKYHLKPGNLNQSLCTSIYWDVKDASSNAENVEGRAKLGIRPSDPPALTNQSDYWLTDENEPPLPSPPNLLFPTTIGPFLFRSNQRDVLTDNDFQLSVFAFKDLILEGSEIVEVRAYVPALNFLTSFRTVTITEDYRDESVQQDERTGCSCECTTCLGENAVTVRNGDGSVSVSTAGGHVQVSTFTQVGQNTVVNVGLPLPTDRLVPTQIRVELQVSEEMTDAQGNLVGLGRKRVANSGASSIVTLDVPISATPGSTLWFSLQGRLANFVSSWTRANGQPPTGSTGVAEKILPIEVLVNASFSPTALLSEKFSGWIGRFNHAMRDETQSRIAPGFAPGTSVPGIDRMIRNTNILVPDPVGTGVSGNGGKVKREIGTMLFRADGGTSWFKDNSQPSPDSHDILVGDILTDRYGNKAKYNALGDLIERSDPVGNKTTFGYFLDGGISTITDYRGKQTTFVRSVDALGRTVIRVSSINNAANLTLNQSYAMTWIPFGTVPQLKILYDDPDGTGPRLAREDVFNFSGYALSSFQTGEVSSPIRTTTFSYTGPEISDGRVFAVNYPDGSSLQLELTRQRNVVIPGYYIGGTITAIDPRALRVAPPGSGANQIPNYVVTTFRHSANSDPQRTIYQLDHRGRVLRVWDAEQVFMMGLQSAIVNTAMFQTLQSNLNRSYEYQLEPTQRDTNGRIVGKDYGEVRVSISPDPDLLASSDGPRTRQTVAATYTNNNPVTVKQPIQNQEILQWNNTFGKLTDYKDETGNITHQVLNPSNGLLTQLRSGDGALWQNPDSTLDVDHDGGISPLDVLAVINYINTNGSGAPVPEGPPPQPFGYFLDVDGDFTVGPLDVLAIIDWLNGVSFEQPGVVSAKRQTDFTYAAANVGLPKGLVETETISTGRLEGNHVVTYTYYNTPLDPARHGKVSTMYESTPTGGTATTIFTYDDRGNQNSITDSAGRITKFWYDNRDRLIARLDPDPDLASPLLPSLTRYDYDVFDNVIATELINSWIANSVLFASALTTSFSYDGVNRIASLTTQKPDTIWYLTNSSGNIARSTTKPVVTAAISNAMLENYAAANLRIVNVPSTNIALQGLVRDYNYFTLSPNEIRITESNAGSDPRVSKVTLDRLDRITKEVSPNPGANNSNGQSSSPNDQIDTSGGFITRTEYDNLGNVTKITDSLNNATIWTYDDLNRVTKISEPGPTPLSNRFDTTVVYTAYFAGWSTTTTDPSGRATIVQSDMLGRPTKISGTAQSSQTIRYWMDDKLRSVTDELSRATKFYYDQRGRLTATETPPADASTFESRNTTYGYTSYAYSIDSLVLSMTAPMSRKTVYQYDDAGRLQKTTEPDPDGAGPLSSAFMMFGRDSAGNVRSQTDGLSQTTSYEQDAWFRNKTETDPRNAVTTKVYDVFGNVTNVTDQLTNSTSYAYNKLNQLTAETKGIYGSRSFLYDAVGNQKQLTDRNGRVTGYNFDNRYRLTSETWNPSSVVRSFAYSYDSSDRLTGVLDSDPLAPDFSYTYDTRSQLQTEIQTGSSYVSKPINFDRKYNEVGSEVKLEANIGGTLTAGGTSFTGGVTDFRNNYSYDGRDRLVSITQFSAGGTVANTVAPKYVSLNYNAASQVTDITRYANTSPTTQTLKVATRNNYDLAGRLQSITHSKTPLPINVNWDGSSTAPNADTVAAYYVTYDQANQVKTLASRADGFKTTFGYDARGQLQTATSAQIVGLTTPFSPLAENYAFDSNGNRLAANGTSQSSQTSHNRLQTDGTFNYVYDNEGNVNTRTRISDGTVTNFAWDFRNRLTTVTTNAPGTKKTEYTYDVFDQRTAKRVDVDGNGTWDRYEVYSWADGQEVLRWVDSDGQAAAQELRLANRYLWSNAVDQLLADEQYLNNTGMPISATGVTAVAGNTLWALNDNLGSVRDLIDNNGVVRQHVVYDSFGKRIREVDYNTAGAVIASNNAAAIDTIFGYTGRDWDADIGMQYNRARWYDPSTGRWLSQDPIGFSAGDANLYRYVGNESTNATDPSGLQELEKYPTPFGPLTRRPNALPQPSMYTPWKNTMPSYPIYVEQSGKDWLKFNRHYSVSNYRNSGFSLSKANDAFSHGCFGLASYRLGRNGNMIRPGDSGIETFTNLPSAWAYLENQVAAGKKMRILIMQSAYPPTLPPNHDPLQPIPTDFPVLQPAPGGFSMITSYDYATLHWDSYQRQYFWESQANGKNDPTGGQHWKSASPLSGLKHTIFMAVEITPEFEKCAQGLPAVPWKE